MEFASTDNENSNAKFEVDQKIPTIWDLGKRV